MQRGRIEGEIRYIACGVSGNTSPFLPYRLGEEGARTATACTAGGQRLRGSSFVPWHFRNVRNSRTVAGSVRAVPVGRCRTDISGKHVSTGGSHVRRATGKVDGQSLRSEASHIAVRRTSVSR